MSSNLLPGPLWLIGCGNMAGAMLGRWLDVGLDPALVTVIRPSGAPVGEKVRVVTAPPDGDPPAVALLGVKPQMLREVAPVYRGRVADGTILISILAGVDVSALRALFPRAAAIVRAMPNMPVGLGLGATALCGDEAGREVADALMAPLGLTEWVDERHFHLVSALTASGPAFVFRFIDALAAGAADLGLPAGQAERLAIAMVEGAAALAGRSDELPDRLADRVASPGGMTRKGLDVLDSDDALRRLVRETLQAATHRSRELGEIARGG